MIVPLPPPDPPLAVTVTVHVAVLLPSTVLTVIVAVPAAIAVTTPPSTVTTLLSLVDHVTFLFVALLGLIVATKVSVPPAVMDVEFLFKDTLVTATLLTVICFVA